MNINQLFASTNLLNVSGYRTELNVCLKTPPQTVSDGIWGGKYTERSPLRSSFPVFLLQIIIIYTLTRALHFPLKKFSLPSIISQIIAGLIMGPSLKIFEKSKIALFPYGSQDTLATITSLGYVLFVFENGVKTDLSMMSKIRRKEGVIALVGLLLPLLIGFPRLRNLSAILKNNHSAVVILMTQNVTSFAVIASALNDLKILNSELGRLALSSALVGDILSNLLIISATLFDKNRLLTNKGVGIDLAWLCALIIIMFFVYRPTMFWVIEHTPERQEVKDFYINIILGILFILGWCSTTLLRQEPILLPFIFGLATPDGPPLGSSLVKRIHVFGMEFLLPIFVTTCAMKINFGLLKFTSVIMTTTILIILVGHLTKMIAYTVTSLLFKIPPKDAVSLALILNCKGVVEVAMYCSALDKYDIKPEIYAVALTTIMITSSIVHLMVKRLYDPSRKYVGYQKRNISSLKPDSNIRILVCIHKQHHTIPMIRVIDLCNPTPQYPTTVDVLHLIELVGRSSPIFISHRMKKSIPSGSRNSYSENVILSFKIYEDEKLGATTINPYTAISPPTLMHEDVCFLALEKVASIIILPFHRKWSINGKIELDDKTVRLLNCKIMEKAPCSVGILVSRYVHQKDSPLRLAMLYLGGNDDREALCLANRAAKDSSTVNLVVYHITTPNDNDKEGIQDLNTMLDHAILNDAKKECSTLENVTHKEIMVEDGAQLASIIRQMAHQHDFFIVGRRHGIHAPQTNGLQDWTEFSELGVIGDFLASTDLDCKSSLLVVQQQQFFH